MLDNEPNASHGDADEVNVTAAPASDEPPKRRRVRKTAAARAEESGLTLPLDRGSIRVI